MLEEEKQERKQGDVILGIMFIIFLSVCILGNFIIADKDKSEEENRSLAQKPKMDKENILRGSFMNQYEDYLSDQFIGRYTLREMNIFVKIIGGSRKEEEIFLGNGGQLLKNISKPDMEVLNANINAINSLVQEAPENGKENESDDDIVNESDNNENNNSENNNSENSNNENSNNENSNNENNNGERSQRNLKIYMMLVPDCTEIYKELLPKFAKVESEKKWFDFVSNNLSDDIIWIDGISVMSKYKNEKLYYRTDHHWTTLGAYHMFYECMEIFGIGNKDGDDEMQLQPEYDKYPVTTQFNGMLSGNSGFCPNIREEIDVYIPAEGANSVIINYVDEKKRTTSLYDLHMLKEKDKYSVFLGGNSSLIDIRTSSVSEKKILIIKDSFANCFIPFMAEYYSEIVVVDPRYYSGTMKDVMDTYDIDEILFLYSGDTFLADNNIEGFIAD